uniref:Secreted protein n=1 Tax=Rhipicephalus microplus TaxID=6941 RepID=A0A6M2DCR1_RHIMP
MFFFCVVVCSVSVAVSQNFLRDTLTMEYIHRAVFSCEFLFILASRTTLFFPLWAFIYCEYISPFFFSRYLCIAK